jgi:hypothetical protein
MGPTVEMIFCEMPAIHIFNYKNVLLTLVHALRAHRYCGQAKARRKILA